MGMRVRVFECLREKNMSQTKLADETGISVSTIYQYIDGRMLPTIGAFLTKNLL